MKKVFLSLIITLLVSQLLVGCKKEEPAKPVETAKPAPIVQKVDKPVAPTKKQVDVDLTILSSTMVYAQVLNMMEEPDNYIGKSVRMQGNFAVYANSDQSQFYPAVVVADATACCAQGIEFVLQGNPKYPDGYPKMDADVTVVGTYETYLEDGYLYCHLIDAVIE